MKELSGLWSGKNERGEYWSGRVTRNERNKEAMELLHDFLMGSIEAVQITIFPNRKRPDKRDPDYRIVVSEARPREERNQPAREQTNERRQPLRQEKPPAGPPKGGGEVDW